MRYYVLPGLFLGSLLFAFVITSGGQGKGAAIDSRRRRKEGWKERWRNSGIRLLKAQPVPPEVGEP